MATYYKTSDGKTFNYEKQARDHQDYIDGINSIDFSGSDEDICWQYNSQGNVFFKEKNYDAAIAKYTDAIKYEGKNKTFAYFNRGVAYFNKGEYDKAIADYKEAGKRGHNNAKEAIAEAEQAKANTSPAIRYTSEIQEIIEKAKTKTASKQDLNYLCNEATSFMNGITCPKDEAKAIELFTIAAEAGNKYAKDELAKLK